MYLGRWHQGRFRRGSRNDLNYSSASSKPYPRRIQTSPRPSHARSRSRKGLPKIAGERATRGGIDRSSLGAPVSPSPIDPLLQSFASSAGGRSSRFFFFFLLVARCVCKSTRRRSTALLPFFFLRRFCTCRVLYVRRAARCTTTGRGTLWRPRDMDIRTVTFFLLVVVVLTFLFIFFLFASVLGILQRT